VLILLVIAGLLLAVFGLPQLGLFGNPGCGLPLVTCTRVLFVGDSYTYVNDLPTTFANLAWSAGERVETQTLADGGETLAGHVADAATASTIDAQTWNTVVLQDQSENPASPAYRQTEMYPAATQLVALIRHAGEQPLLFLTWGHQSGWPQDGLPTYATMQAAVDQGYIGLAAELAVPIAPVGAAWQTVVTAQASPELWQGDGVHPTTAGTYLAACVFFATIFRRSPVGLNYVDGLPKSEAAMLQRVAAMTALTGRAEWAVP
jgi:lysophospholipase L1-like esterase